MKLFVRDEDDNLIAQKDLLPGEKLANSIGFSVPADGNYRIGIESDGEKPCEAKIYHTVLGNMGRKYPFHHIIYDQNEPHKMLFASEGITTKDV